MTSGTVAEERALGPGARTLPRWRRWYRENQRLVLGIAGILSVLIPWELLVRFGIVKAIFISSPTRVYNAFVQLVQSGVFWDHFSATMQVWVAGFLLAAVAGVFIGLTAGWFRRVSYVAQPWLNVLFAAPDLAFVPIFILWFGIGFTFKVWVVFLGALFYIAINVLAGVHSTEERYLAVARTFGASRLTVFRTIVLPGSVPFIITGLRLGAGRALVGVVAAEFISANVGIGFLISVAGSTLNTALVMVGISIIAFFGVVTGEILRRVEARFDVWRREANA